MAGKKGTTGGPRPGSGRPACFKARNDDYLIIERSSINESKFYPPELGRVCGVNEKELELQIGNEILVIRFPDDGEIEVSLK